MFVILDCTFYLALSQPVSCDVKIIQQRFGFAFDKNVAPPLSKMRHPIDDTAPSRTFLAVLGIFSFVGKTKILHLVMTFFISVNFRQHGDRNFLFIMFH